MIKRVEDVALGKGPSTVPETQQGVPPEEQLLSKKKQGKRRAGQPAAELADQVKQEAAECGRATGPPR